MERFNKAADKLARSNGAIVKIEIEGGESVDGKVVNASGRVFLRGVFKESEIIEHFDTEFPELNLKSIPSDSFEEFGDGYVTYVSLEDTKEE